MNKTEELWLNPPAGGLGKCHSHEPENSFSQEEPTTNNKPQPPCGMGTFVSVSLHPAAMAKSEPPSPTRCDITEPFNQVPTPDPPRCDVTEPSHGTKCLHQTPCAVMSHNPGTKCLHWTPPHCDITEPHNRAPKLDPPHCDITEHPAPSAYTGRCDVIEPLVLSTDTRHSIL